MLEKEFAKQVETMLNVFGWTWKHDLPALHQSGKWATAVRGSIGFPDYIAVRGDRLICAEIKNEKGRLRAEQRKWIDLLEQSGRVEVYVWRPSDLQAIAEILR